MAGFFYFIPGDPRELVKLTDSYISAELLAKADLLDALGDWRRVGNETVVHRTTSFEGRFQQGVILFPRSSDGGDLPTTIYEPGRMNFMMYRGKHWIGWLKNDQPTPEDLLRKSFYHSYFLTDEVNQQWLVPIISSPKEDRGSLPVEVTVDMETGKAKIQQKARYRGIWELTGEIRDRMKNKVEITTDWLLDCGIAILNVNYRLPKSAIGPLVAMGRSLFDSERLQLISMMACDWPLVQEYESIIEDIKEKKTAEGLPPDSPRLSFGQEADIESELQLAGSLR